MKEIKTKKYVCEKCKFDILIPVGSGLEKNPCPNCKEGTLIEEK